MERLMVVIKKIIGKKAFRYLNNMLLCMLIIAITVLGTSCDNTKYGKKIRPWKQTMEPVLERFPYFREHAKQIIWKSGRLYEYQVFDFAPDVYWLKAYIVCQENLMELEGDIKDWKPAPFPIEERFRFPGKELQDDRWIYSPSFIKRSLPGYRYSGFVYYYPEEQIVFLDVTWE